jgi:hypothetical protein
MNRYLARGITLDELVAWAKETLGAGDLSPDDESVLQDLVARAGAPGDAEFGLTIEEWSDLLRRLGQELRVHTAPLVH